MTVSYWSKHEEKVLEIKTEIIHYQMCKLPNDKHVTNDAISAICAILNIGIDQVMDFIPDEKQKRDFWILRP